jgi:hypothetical protein
MTRRISLLMGLLCLIASVSVGAVSHPPIVGTIFGYEICPKSLCGKAYFFGDFNGLVNKKKANGKFLVGVNYSDLPTSVGVPETITDGTWLIRTTEKLFDGTVTGGTLTYNGDNTFRVVVTLDLNRGGSGTLTADVTLDHNPDIPTVFGSVLQ